MREFIGAGHREVLEVLRSRVQGVAAGDVISPRVVILEGPSGVGKSRVVRELYRTMRADYDPQGYWPDLDEDFHTDAPDGDPLAGRKDIGPPAAGFVWPAGVLPGFGWWQLHCDRISTGMVDVAAQARPDIAAHQVPLSLAWKQAASPGQILHARRDAVIDAAREALVTDGPVEAAGQLLAQFDLTIPGLGTAASWAMRAVHAGQHRRQLRRDTRDEVDLGPRADAVRRSVSTELADLIRGVAHPRVPGVVVIEDLQLMDDALVEFLDDLANPRRGTPVMVIAMTWPEARHTGTYARWAEKALAAGRAQVIPMPELSDDDLRRMILIYAPQSPDDTVDQALQHMRNPLHVEAALGGAVREAINRNGGALPPAILTKIPRSIEGVYEKRFRALSDEVQRGLAIAAGALPDPTSNRLWPFVRDIVADAADRCTLVPDTASQVLGGIDYAAHERVWLIPTGVADTFREALQARIAHQHLADPTFVGPTADTDIRHAVHTVLTERINHARDGGYLLDSSDEMTLLSRWLLSLS